MQSIELFKRFKLLVLFVAVFFLLLIHYTIINNNYNIIYNNNNNNNIKTESTIFVNQLPQCDLFPKHTST
jgi:hypothetical protein